MRCIIQRVNRASIVINGKSGGQIGKGLLVLCAFSDGDDEKTVDYCVEKIANLRIFEDENGNVMVVSNFTLYADTRKGRRPSFDKSARPEISKPLYDLTVKKFSDIFENLVTGEFGAYMQISFENDGPVTLIVEKENE
ncbi:MAG: D-tyrosyl-tRNA(Tyr) deacylase [Clostridium sp. CAG:349_48_7]|nr:MAG: D-tyrosyl-tRNA(Tyr) deacylase [Clostridium sp. CAG:349_48_7]